MNATDREGHKIVKVAYIHPDSPLKNSLDKNNEDENGNPNIIEVKIDTSIQSVILDGFTSFAFYTDGAEVMRDLMEQGTQINDLTVQIVGGGIRGSIITTIWMIVLTLILSVPVGIATAIYFNEFSKNQNLHQLYGV